MKKNSIKVLSLILVLVMAFSMVPVNFVASAAASKTTQINSIIKACSESYVNSSDYWKVLGMARLQKGAAVDNTASIAASVTEAKKAFLSPTALGMWIATLNALGYDCTAINDPSGGTINLVEKLYNMSNADIDAWPGNYIYWLLAINSGEYTVPAGAIQTVDRVITELIKTQDADGGWSYTYGGTIYPDMDTAAMAISALAPYYSNIDVKTAVDKAVSWLETKQIATGGYGNTNTDAMVVIALTSMGINPDTDVRFIRGGKSVIDDMLSYKTSDNFFGYYDTTFDDFATKQGFCTLVAYKEFLKDTSIGYNIYKSGAPLGALTTTNLSIVTNPSKINYLINENFNPSGMTIELTYSNTVKETIAVTLNMISGFDSSTTGAKTLSATYGGVSKTFSVTVYENDTPPPEVETKTVSIYVKGDAKKGIILSQRSLEVDEDASVFTVLKNALSSEDIELAYSGSEKSAYIIGINGLEQYDKGPNSGWRYFVNGTAPNVSCGRYIPSDGDEIEFLYTTDYTKDEDFLELEEEQEEQELPLDEKQIKEILSPFKDTENISSWATANMAKAIKLGIIKGDSQNKLNPQSSITRGEFCAMLIRALKQGVSDDKISFFNDVPAGTWYNAYIKKAAELGIVKGTGDKLFSPDSPITRQDMAVMVSIAFELSIKDNKASFGDNEKIASYASDAVLKVFSNNIMQGDGQNFNPTEQTTREMAVAVLIRYLDTLKQEK